MSLYIIINKFDGTENRFLSNFYASIITYNDVEYPTVEHAYQAAKTFDNEERSAIRFSGSPARAKKLGRAVVCIRDDWEEIKDGVMLCLLRKKFAIPQLKEKLLDTGDSLLEEGNTWGDTYWGTVNGVGKNMLGKLLMKVRNELK